MIEDPEYLCSATLIILGNDLVSKEITDRLRIEPDQAWRKGERKPLAASDLAGNSFNESYEWGGWKSYIPDAKKTLELSDQLAYWCGRLEGREPLMRELKRQGCELKLSCYVSTNATASILISAALQGRLSSLGLELSFSFFVEDLPDATLPNHGLQRTRR